MKQKLPSVRKRAASSSEFGSTPSLAAANDIEAALTSPYLLTPLFTDTNTNAAPTKSPSRLSVDTNYSSFTRSSASFGRGISSEYQLASRSRLNELAPLSPHPMGPTRPPELLKLSGNLRTQYSSSNSKEPITPLSTDSWVATRGAAAHVVGGSWLHPKAVLGSDAGEQFVEGTSTDASAEHGARFSRFGSTMGRGAALHQVIQRDWQISDRVTERDHNMNETTVLFGG